MSMLIRVLDISFRYRGWDMGHANPRAHTSSLRDAISDRGFSFLFRKIFILHNFLILKNYNL